MIVITIASFCLGNRKRILFSILFPILVFIVSSIYFANELLGFVSALSLIPIFLLFNLNEKFIILLSLVGLIIVTFFPVGIYQSSIVIECYWQLLMGTIIMFIRTLTVKK